VRYVARMGLMKRKQYFSRKTWKERDHLEYLGVDGKILLKWVFHPSNGATAQIGPWPPLSSASTMSYH
jgi:hypothetical protein